MATDRPDKTIGEFIRALKPGIRRRARCPVWPPDCFAIALSLLKATCAYTDLLAEWPPTGETFETWTRTLRERGMRWRNAWRLGRRFRDLDNEWRTVLVKFDDTL